MEIKVNRNTVFETFLGEDLRINCTVEFCSDSTPSVSWNKQKNNVHINISSSAHIKTEWKRLGDLVGMSFLIFQNVGINDSGLYQCDAEGIVSHLINVSVHGEWDFHSNSMHLFGQRGLCHIVQIHKSWTKCGLMSVKLLIAAVLCFAGDDERNNFTRSKDPSKNDSETSIPLDFYVFS